MAASVEPPAAPLPFGAHPLTPARVLDTRAGVGAPNAPVGEGESIAVQVTGTGGVPEEGVGAVVLNVTATQPTTSTYVTVFPTGEGRPLASNLNLVAGQTAPNLVVAKIGAGGKVSLFNSAGTTHLIADVMGWFPAGESFHGLTPARVLDTRAGVGAPNAPVGEGESIAVQVTGTGGVPEEGVGAVVLNVTATQPTTSTYVTVFPTGEGRPLASNLNLVAGQTAPNLVVAKIGAGGKVSLFNSAGTTHLIADVMGWFPLRSLVDADTIALTGDELDPVASIDATSLTVTETLGAWAEVGLGSVLAGGVSPTTPTGFLVEVTGMVENADGTSTFTTVPASLNDAIAEGELHVDFGGAAPQVADFGGLAPQALPSAESQSIGAALELTRPFEATETVTGPHGSATASASGSVSIGASASLDVEIGWIPPGVTATFQASANEAVNGSVSLSGEAAWSKTWDLGEWEFGTYTFAIGPVPVVVQPQLELAANAAASANGNVEMGFTQSGSVTAGITYDGGFAPFESHAFQPPTMTGPTVEAEATASIGVDASVEIEFYGAAEAGLTLSPHLDLVADLCKADLSWGLDAAASFELEISDFIDEEQDIPLGTLGGGTLAEFNMPTETNQCRPWTGQDVVSGKTDAIGGVIPPNNVEWEITYSIPEGSRSLLPTSGPDWHSYEPVEVSAEVTYAAFDPEARQSRDYVCGNNICRDTCSRTDSGTYSGAVDTTKSAIGMTAGSGMWQIEGNTGDYLVVPFSISYSDNGLCSEYGDEQSSFMLRLSREGIATQEPREALVLAGSYTDGHGYDHSYSFERPAIAP